MRVLKYVSWLVLGLSIGCCDSGYSSELSAGDLRLIDQAASEYGVNSDTLVRIAYLESRYDGKAVRVNRNGTIDYGMFQINSVHWSTTCKGIDVMNLLGNARCAGRLLSGIKRYAAVDRNWIGRYHSKTPSRKASYARALASIDLGE